MATINPTPLANNLKLPRSTLVSRNVTISGRRTSVRLEPEMWSGLFDICRREGASLHEICTVVSLRKDPNTSLTAAIRVFVMTYYRASSTEEGHAKAGHGYGLATWNTATPANSSLPNSAEEFANKVSPEDFVVENTRRNSRF